MRSSRIFRTGMICTLFTTLWLSMVSEAANNGREFSGYFDVSGVQEQSELVQVTLHLKLFNHSDVDAKGVIVALMDATPAMILRGSFQPVKVWKSQHFIEMSREFTVTKREYKQWMTPPMQPNLIILYQDAKGQTWRKGAQISRRPLVPIAQ
jgi:hypothetical protein